MRKVLERERMDALEAREAVRRHERNEAARHAQNILDGKREADPENEQIRALEKELEELQQQKRQLFGKLSKMLGSDLVEKRENVKMEDVVEGTAN